MHLYEAAVFRPSPFRKNALVRDSLGFFSTKDEATGAIADAVEVDRGIDAWSVESFSVMEPEFAPRIFRAPLVSKEEIPHAKK